MDYLCFLKTVYKICYYKRQSIHNIKIKTQIFLHIVTNKTNFGCNWWNYE